MTLRALYDALRGRLKEGGVEAAAFEADCLLEHFAKRSHSFLASGINQSGQAGIPFAGTGSFVFNFLLPGLPSSFFTAVGFGFLPAIGIPPFSSSNIFYCQNHYFYI